MTITALLTKRTRQSLSRITGLLEREADPGKASSENVGELPPAFAYRVKVKLQFRLARGSSVLTLSRTIKISPHAHEQVRTLGSWGFTGGVEGLRV